MRPFTEYPLSKPCPCGSGKPYRLCCKTKAISYGFNANGKLIKRIPIPDPLLDKLQEEACKFQEYYGREPSDSDYVAPFAPVCNDKMLLDVMTAMQKADVPDSYIYAYYKTDGLMPCSLNQDIMSEKNKAEFSAYEKEYVDIMFKPVSDSIPAMKFVALVNDHLTDRLRVQEMLIDSLNDFLHRHSEKVWQRRCSSMETELDYLCFSALKTIKTLTGIRTLSEGMQTECIASLGRSLYENYLYLNQLNCNKSFFREKLLPKADSQNYSFALKENGKPDFRRRQNNHTREIFDIHVSISSLKYSLQSQEDIDLYELFYSDSCQYVHVDFSTAKSYFYSFDPYDEVNPALCEATVCSGIALLMFYALARNKHVQAQFQKDAINLIHKIAAKLSSTFEILVSDAKYSKPIYTVLATRMCQLTEI